MSDVLSWKDGALAGAVSRHDFDILALTTETRMDNGDDKDARSMRQDPC
jgi:RNase P/RNase MRP subunit p30